MGDDAAVRGSPSPPFAGLHAAARGRSRRHLRLTQPAVRGRSRRWPAADSSPPARRCLSPVDLVHMLRPGVPFLSRVVSTGAVLIQSCLVMSMETRLGQAAPLVTGSLSNRFHICDREAIPAACLPVADVEAVAEGPCEGP